MNAIRGMVHLSLRGYRTNRRNTSARYPKSAEKPPRQVEMLQPGMIVQDLLEPDDPEDLDAFESDFMNVGEYDKMHEKEMEVEKKKLLTRIVKRKYFKSQEPAMLTWGEKEQIRYLHKEDPEEWTPERLSESFPASREAVLKILRANWSVKSVRVVEKYEENVKKNWALFKAGKLEVDPELEAHFAKFENREIKVTDPKIIAQKILKPKSEFPNPRSTIFSNIIKGYLEDNPARRGNKEVDSKDRNSSESKSFRQIGSSESMEVEKSRKISATAKLATDRKEWKNTSLTVDQFLQNHVESVREDKITPVDRVVVDEMKRQGTEAYKNDSLVLRSENPVAAWKDQDETKEKRTDSNESEETAWIVPKEKKKNSNSDLALSKTPSEAPVLPELANISEGSLETGIIARVKTEAALQDIYPDFIRIPRKKYKPGATYRVQDRYYDDDGELLYRVPGLKT